jgi:hypothetical protein
MKILSSALLLLLLMVPQGPAFAEEGRGGPREGRHVEAYRYEAVPLGREKDTEQIRVDLSFDREGIGFASTALSDRGKEHIVLKLTGEGDLIWGERDFYPISGKLTEERIWREGHRVYMDQTSGTRKKTSAVNVPEGLIPAVESSMLVRLRRFPYGSTDSWKLLMFNFRGKSAPAAARQNGVERITVPAGQFPCYRVEVTFHVFIFRPQVVCWVAEEKPHVLVKSVGKRRFFGPIYVTTSVGTDQGARAGRGPADRPDQNR